MQSNPLFAEIPFITARFRSYSSSILWKPVLLCDSTIIFIDFYRKPVFVSFAFRLAFLMLPGKICRNQLFLCNNKHRTNKRKPLLGNIKYFKTLLYLLQKTTPIIIDFLWYFNLLLCYSWPEIFFTIRLQILCSGKIYVALYNGMWMLQTIGG